MKNVALIIMMMAGLKGWSQQEVISVSNEPASGTIAGWVVTADQQPAAGVTVWLRGTTRMTQTDTHGRFQLHQVPEGIQVLYLSMTGLKPKEEKVTVSNGKLTEISIMLLEDAHQLAEVEVRAQRNMNQRTSTIGKLPVAQKDLPQAFTILDKSLLDKQQVTSMSDALQMVNGVYIMSTSGGYQEEIAARGYAFGSSNTFRNGARVNNGIKPEFSSVEKVEILKGGNAILYGNVGAGGILNIVTRKPKFEKGGSIGFRLGSFSFYKPSFDMYGPVGNSKTLAFRINGTYENAGSFRDQVHSERLYANPSFLFLAGKKTEILLEGDALKDERTPDYGTGAINYQIAPIPRNRYLNVSWAYNKTQQYTSTATITHKFNQHLNIRAIGSYQHFDNNIFSANRPNASGSSVSENGTWARGLQRTAMAENYFFGSADLNAKLRTGRIEHIILAGMDADRYHTRATTFDTYSNLSAGGKNIYDTINIFDPATINRRTDIPYLEKNRLTTAPVTRLGIYVQDLVSLLPGVKLLAGLRYSFLKNETTRIDSLHSHQTGYVKGNENQAFSPRLGIVFQPAPFLSLFASYTNSFATNSGLDINNQALRPSIIDQMETGIKSDLFRGRLSANVTVYRIVNSNLAQTALFLADGITPNNNSSIKELTGETTSKGIEVDLMSTSIHGFNMVAGYSYNDMRYTKMNGNTVNGNRAGERLRYNPAHTANASVFYTFRQASKWKGLYMGAGAFYAGNRLAGRNPTNNPSNTNKLMPLPDYITIDLHAGYTFKKLSARIKVSNLLDQLSYNAHDDNSINPIAPRQFMATINYKF